LCGEAYQSAAFLFLCIVAECANFAVMPSSRSYAARAGNSRKGGLFVLFVLLLGIGGGYILYLCFQAEDLSDVAGWRGIQEGSVKNLTAELAVGMSAGSDVILTEEEINRYLASTLKLSQGGMFSGQSQIKGVAVRLDEGVCEVVFVRELYGRPHTVSLHYAPRQVEEGGRTVWEVSYAGGRFGRMPVGGVFLGLATPGHRALAAAYSDEMRILRHANDLRLEKGRAIVGPARVE